METRIRITRTRATQTGKRKPKLKSFSVVVNVVKYALC